MSLGTLQAALPLCPETQQDRCQDTIDGNCIIVFQKVEKFGD